MPLLRSTAIGAVVLGLASCNENAPQIGRTSSETPSVGASVLGSPPAEQPSAASHSARFEGELQVLVKSGREARPVTVAVSVKDRKARFTVPDDMKDGPAFASGAAIIVDGSQNKLYAVAEPQKQVVVIDLRRMGEHMMRLQKDEPAERRPLGTPAKVTRTGTMDSIVGQRCEEWDVLRSNGERTKVCVASAAAPWLDLPGMSLPEDGTWARQLLDGKHLPLRVVAYDPEGAEEARLEVVRFDRKAVDESLFVIPPSYRVLDLSALSAGFGPGPGGPAGASHPQVPALSQEMVEMVRERAKAAGSPPPR